jgi:hypothetical protein
VLLRAWVVEVCKGGSHGVSRRRRRHARRTPTSGSCLQAALALPLLVLPELARCTPALPGIAPRVSRATPSLRVPLATANHRSAPLARRAARCRRCGARSSPCRPSWSRCRAQSGTAATECRASTAPRRPRSCPAARASTSSMGAVRRSRGQREAQAGRQADARGHQLRALAQARRAGAHTGGVHARAPYGGGQAGVTPLPGACGARAARQLQLWGGPRASCRPSQLAGTHLLPHAHHHAGVARPPNNAGKHCAGGVVARKAGLQRVTTIRGGVMGASRGAFTRRRAAVVETTAIPTPAVCCARPGPCNAP